MSLEHILTVFLKPAGLRLLARHASQFNHCLLDHYRTLFEVMSKLCGHINNEMKNTSHYALEAFLKQVNTHQTHWPNFTKTKKAPLLYSLFSSYRLHCWWQTILRSTKTSWSSSCRSSVASSKPGTRHIRSCPLPFEDMDSLQLYAFFFFFFALIALGTVWFFFVLHEIIPHLIIHVSIKVWHTTYIKKSFSHSRARRFAHRMWTWCTRSWYNAVSRCTWQSPMEMMTASTSCPASWTP